MSSSSNFACNNNNCNEVSHDKQVFISHAAKDKELADKIADAGCRIGVASYLFELSPDSYSENPPASAIEENVAASDAVLVLLSDAVSKAYWTQAWIGFEVGVMRGTNIANRLTAFNGYFSKRIFVLQDIRQGIEVSVPQLDALLVFDFGNDEGWNLYQDMIWVITLRNGVEFYKKGNEFRQATMNANVKCDNCRSEYDALIVINDAMRLGKAFNPISNNPIIQAECTIECPSCDKMVTRIFTQML